MRKKGFTILETMISVTIFSVLMIIVFSCWTEFQKVALKNEGKHDTNITFVNVYRNIDKYVSSSSVRLFRHYTDSSLLGVSGHENKRWFAFLVSRENNQLDGKPIYRKIDVVKNETPKSLSERMVYNTCVMYLLRYKSGCCGGFQNCPHKSLYRYVFNIVGTEHIPIGIYFGNNYRYGVIFNSDVIQNKVLKILQNPESNSVAQPSVIQNNIVDLKIKKNDDKVQFYLKVLRISEAERVFTMGTRQLTNLDLTEEFNITDPEVKKYIENLSWISIPSNT